jgi:hypothetical protein
MFNKDPPDVPIVVHVNYFILGLVRINHGGANNFHVDFYFDAYWKDERCIGRKEDDIDWTKNWQPGIEITNAQSSTEREFENYMLDSETGDITYQTRFKAKCAANHMDLSEFPFDTQVLDIIFETSSFTSDQVELRMKRGTGNHVESKLVAPGGLAEWELLALRELERDSILEFDGSTYSTVEVHIVVKRLAGFYLKKIVTTICLIVGMSWSVFFMDPADIGDRVGISATMSLTTIAFNFVVNESLPRVNYYTTMDKYLTFCFVVVVFTVLENVLVYKLNQYDGVWKERAAAVDTSSFIAAVLLTTFATLWFLSNHLTAKNIEDPSADRGYRDRRFGSTCNKNKKND